MKAIIHIGMMKTGSSSMQTWMRSSRAALASAGVRTNEDAVTFENLHRRALTHAAFELALYEFDDKEKAAWANPEGAPKKSAGMREISKKLTERFEKLSAKSGTFIYSDETLYNFNEIQMIELDSFLSRFFEERNYVVYIRDFVDFFVSMYSQKLQNKRSYEHCTQEYSKFLENCMNNLVPYGIESSYRNLFEWSKVFGDRLHVRLLESDWLIKGDLIEDFASFAGVSMFVKPDRINESLAAEYVEYVRQLNRKFRNNLRSKIRRKVISILLDASFGKPKLAASDAQAKKIRDNHREQEECIRKRFFPDRSLLFSQKFRGGGVAPAPLTNLRKAAIESEIRENCRLKFGRQNNSLIKVIEN